MKLNKKILIFAILLGLVATWVTYSYIKSMRTTVVDPVEYTEVVSAIDNIPAYTKITEEMLDTISVPTDLVHPEAVLTKEDIVGGTTNTELIKGEQVLKSRVVTDVITASLSYRIEENMRAITIPISEVSGIAGYAEPGDRIDILVSYTESENEETAQTEGEPAEAEAEAPVSSDTIVYTQLQNIEILEEGPYTIDEQAESGISSFTIMVNPGQAEVLAFALINGTIQCTLRNPVDNVKTELQKYGSDNFDTWRDR